MNDLASLPAAPPIASDDECASAIARKAEIDRDLARIESGKSAAVAKAGKPYEDRATPLLAEKAALEARIEAYSVANRDRILVPGKKHAEFPTGEVGWRDGRPSVEIDEANAHKIVAALKGIRGWYKRFVQVTEKPSKSKIGAATPEEKAKLAKIKGITFVPAKESFWIKPTGSELAERPQEAADA
jgi:phage host-nuclease inhibitor protein Gam